MIVPDVNLVLYAEVAAFPEHATARKWWEKALGGADEVGLAPPVLFGFVRIATNPRVFAPPMPIETLSIVLTPGSHYQTCAYLFPALNI